MILNIFNIPNHVYTYNLIYVPSLCIKRIFHKITRKVKEKYPRCNLYIVHVTDHNYLMLPRYVIPYIFFTQAYDCIGHTGCTHVHDLFSWYQANHSVTRIPSAGCSHALSTLGRKLRQHSHPVIYVSTHNLFLHLFFFFFFFSYSFSYSFPFVSCFIRFKRVQTREQDFKMIKVAESFLLREIFFFEEYREKMFLSIHWLKQNLCQKILLG